MRVGECDSFACARRPVRQQVFYCTNMAVYLYCSLEGIRCSWITNRILQVEISDRKAGFHCIFLFLEKHLYSKKRLCLQGECSLFLIVKGSLVLVYWYMAIISCSATETASRDYYMSSFTRDFCKEDQKDQKYELMHK